MNESLHQQNYPPGRSDRAKRMRFLAILFCCQFALAAHGEDRLLADRPLRTASWPTTFIGNNRSYRIAATETLTELARAAQVGYTALCDANPQLDPWLPTDGATVILPGFSIVPAIVSPGITINIPEYRLYFLAKEADEWRLHSYPVGIGMAGDETPSGRFKVREKLVKPTWQVPASVRKARQLPRRIPPGPNNPLGEFWLGISADGVGIHGTNEPFGVGRRASRGCIRLYPEDIRELFPRVAVGTAVTIINQPLKLGVRYDALFLEAHPDILPRGIDPLTEILQQAERLDWRGQIDWSVVRSILEQPTGRPMVIGYRDRLRLAPLEHQ